MARHSAEKDSQDGRCMRPRDEFDRNRLFGQVLMIALGVLTIVTILTVGG